jgi:capsid protein
MKKTIITYALMGMLSTAAWAQNDPIVTDSTSRSTNTNTNTNNNINHSTGDVTNRNISDSKQTIKSPPPTAVAPAVTTINNDVCAVVASGAMQTQIFGISMGGTMRDMNCERIKLSKNLFDMGMKVAAVATLCQDERVFTAMMAAGTPCPVDGKIGAQAKAEWESRGVSVDDKKAIGFYSVRPKATPGTETPVSQ